MNQQWVFLPPDCKAFVVIPSNQMLVTWAYGWKEIVLYIEFSQKMIYCFLSTLILLRSHIESFVRTWRCTINNLQAKYAFYGQTDQSLTSTSQWLCDSMHDSELRFLILKLKIMMPVCGVRLKIKALYYILPWHQGKAWKVRALKGLTTNSLPTLFWWIRSPRQVTLFIIGTKFLPVHD